MDSNVVISILFIYALSHGDCVSWSRVDGKWCSDRIKAADVAWPEVIEFREWPCPVVTGPGAATARPLFHLVREALMNAGICNRSACRYDVAESRDRWLMRLLRCWLMLRLTSDVHLHTDTDTRRLTVTLRAQGRRQSPHRNEIVIMLSSFNNNNNNNNTNIYKAHSVNIRSWIWGTFYSCSSKNSTPSWTAIVFYCRPFRKFGLLRSSWITILFYTTSPIYPRLRCSGAQPTVSKNWREW